MVHFCRNRTLMVAFGACTAGFANFETTGIETRMPAGAPPCRLLRTWAKIATDVRGCSGVV